VVAPRPVVVAPPSPTVTLTPPSASVTIGVH
jgi:hypothetical protein